MISHFAKIEELVLSLDPSVVSYLNQIEQIKLFKKGEILLHEGSICNHSFHITSGIVRKYYLKDGKEVITDFCFEDDIAIAFSSYTFQQPSIEYMDCLTDVEAKVTSRKDWKNAIEKFPVLLELDVLLSEIHAGILEEDLHDLRTLNAKQRYDKLVLEGPELLKYVKLTHIASYLNISLETLSRIRAQR